MLEGGCWGEGAGERVLGICTRGIFGAGTLGEGLSFSIYAMGAKKYFLVIGSVESVDFETWTKKRAKTGFQFFGGRSGVGEMLANFQKSLNSRWVFSENRPVCCPKDRIGDANEMISLTK